MRARRYTVTKLKLSKLLLDAQIQHSVSRLLTLDIRPPAIQDGEGRKFNARGAARVALKQIKSLSIKGPECSTTTSKEVLNCIKKYGRSEEYRKLVKGNGIGNRVYG